MKPEFFAWLGRQWFKIILSLCALLIVGAVVYGMVIIPSQKAAQERMDSQLEASQARFRTTMRNGCLSEADAEYSSLQELNGTKHTDADEII